MRACLAVLCALLLTLSATADSKRHSVRGPATLPPLADDELRYATLEFGSFDIEPGEHRQLRLWILQCCVYYRPLASSMRLTMDPTPYATLDEYGGELVISRDAPAGLQFRVYADIEDGRRIVSTDVTVTTRAANPLRGTWHQVGETRCASPISFSPNEPIQALVFRADGTFSVTWFPFEAYRDYWGVYTIDKPEKGRLTMGIKAGSYIPRDFRGDGKFTVTDTGGKRRLHIDGISFGQPREGDSYVTCGADFESY